MLYAPTNWLAELTKLGPTNLNKLEAGAADASGHHRSGAGRPAAAAGNAGWLWRDPDGTVLLSDGAAWTVFAAGAIPFVTALPAGYDGQEVYYLPDPAGQPGVVWHLKYRAAETGPYKWYFVGGQPIVHNIGTQETCPQSLGAFQDLATLGPILTLPLSGDWQTQAEANYSGNTDTNGYISLADATNAQPTTEVGQCYVVTTPALSVPMHTVSLDTRLNGRAAGSKVKMRYTANRAALNYAQRYLRMTPIRVG